MFVMGKVVTVLQSFVHIYIYIFYYKTLNATDVTSDLKIRGTMV